MDITDQDWKYFEGKWNRYKAYCNLTLDRDLIHNLWECLSDPLMRAATDDGLDNRTINTSTGIPRQDHEAGG